MTVREAFALAGFKFHPESHIVCFKSDYCTAEEPVFIWVYGCPGASGGTWCRFEEHEYQQSYLYGPQVNLANTPAADCLEALPEPVRAAYVDRRSETRPSEHAEVAPALSCKEHVLPTPTEQTVAEEGMREAIEKAIQLLPDFVLCKTAKEVLKAALSNQNAVGAVQGQDVEPLPDPRDLRDVAVKALQAYFDALDIEATQWTGWGECEVPKGLDQKIEWVRGIIAELKADAFYLTVKQEGAPQDVAGSDWELACKIADTCLISVPALHENGGIVKKIDVVAVANLISTYTQKALDVEKPVWEGTARVEAYDIEDEWTPCLTPLMELRDSFQSQVDLGETFSVSITKLQDGEARPTEEE